MKYLSKIFFVVTLLVSTTSFGQFVIETASTIGPKTSTSHIVSTNNLLLESIIVEIALLEIFEYNNINSDTKINLLANNSVASGSTNTSQKSSMFFEYKVNRFPEIKNLPHTNRFRGTAPIHSLPEKFPQVVSAVPSKLDLKIPKPRALGGKLYF